MAALMAVGASAATPRPQGMAQSAATAPVASSAPGTPFTPEQITALLPPSVYFAGRTAPLQTRNAAGTKWGNGAVVWVSLVDNSGYSNALQEKYQFYLVTESPIRFGSVELRPGAYGGGFVGDHFVLLDLGNHTIGEGSTTTDAALRRPRPLQLEPESSDAVKLYLGRRWVELRNAAH